MDADSTDDVSRPLDDEEMAAIAGLTATDVMAIDQAILSQLRGYWQKTAMVVILAMDAYPDIFEDVPDIFYGQRILALHAEGALEAQGDLRRFRFSEIRASVRQASE